MCHAHLAMFVLAKRLVSKEQLDWVHFVASLVSRRVHLLQMIHQPGGGPGRDTADLGAVSCATGILSGF